MDMARAVGRVSQGRTVVGHKIEKCVITCFGGGRGGRGNGFSYDHQDLSRDRDYLEYLLSVLRVTYGRIRNLLKTIGVVVEDLEVDQCQRSGKPKQVELNASIRGPVAYSGSVKTPSQERPSWSGVPRSVQLDSSKKSWMPWRRRASSYEMDKVASVEEAVKD